jgi:hypothetical protein
VGGAAVSRRNSAASFAACLNTIPFK